MKLYRITDYLKNKVFYVGSAPHARKYVSESFEPETVIVEEFDWNHKYQLIVLLNDALKHGQEVRQRHWEMVEDGECV
jgi:hypothetical protein